MNWIPKITSVNKMYNTSFGRFILFFCGFNISYVKFCGYSDSDEGVAEAQTYYQIINLILRIPPPSQDNNQIIDTNSSTTLFKINWQ